MVPTSTAPLSTAPTAAKSMLARLLATENISVVHQNVPTAFFDLKTRSLHLPLWSNASGSLYDMLVGHEVAHALFTPADGWRTAIATVSADTGCSEGTAKQYLNIVEDARIERMIQSRFRGLKADFIAAYKTLMEREFFGDLSDLADKVFADRFNIHFKCGIHAGTAVRFTADEQVMVDRGAAITEWSEVVGLAADMIRFAKEQQQQEQEQEQNAPSDDQSQESGASVDAEGSDDQSQDGKEQDSNDGSGKGDESRSQSQTEGKESESDGKDDSQSNSAGSRNTAPPKPSNVQSMCEDAIAPTTNEALEAALEQFAKTDEGKISEIVRVTTNELSQNAKTVDYTQFLTDMRSSAMSRFMGTPIRIGDYTTATVTMATAFNRRKAADNWRRTSVAKTGSLDTLRMNQYKWTDDIFRRTTRLADGKNHGIVILLDWSASMSAIMQSTMGQLFILADFCRKCSVPFEVYAFSDMDYGASSDSYSKENIADRDARYIEDSNRRDNSALSTRSVVMLNLLSSRMSGTDYEAAKCCLWNWRQMGSCDTRYMLNGTPTTAALLAAAPLVEAFIRRTRVQIAHTVVLTDGEPTDEINFSWQHHEKTTGNRYSDGVAVVMTDPVTGASYDINRVTKWTKDEHGYRKRNGYFHFGTDGIPDTVRHGHSMIAVDIIRRRTASKVHWVGMTYGRRGVDASDWNMTPVKGSNWKRDGFIRGNVWGWDSAIVVDSERILRDANGTLGMGAQRMMEKAEAKMDNAGSNRALATAFMESQIAQGSLRTVATHLGELLAV